MIYNFDLCVEIGFTTIKVAKKIHDIEQVGPIPGITCHSIFAVTANPTRAPARNRLLVLIPIIWSAASSI